MNMNNIKNIQINLNDNNNENNDYLINMKNNRKIIFINPGINEINNNKNNYLNTNIKFKQKMNNQDQKKFIRNLSGENNNLNIGYTTNNNNQQSSIKKEASFINKMLFIKNNNLFPQEITYANNNIKYNGNISKDKTKIKNYKEILSKSNFNDNINKNSIDKHLKQNGNIKYIIPNKTKYKNNNNNSNAKIDNLKKYIKKTEKILQKKNIVKNELNTINNNFVFNNKINSTPIGDINFIFTNPNNMDKKNIKSKNYILRNSLIYYDNANNKQSNNKNNNYIINMNKYINLINKKNKIINKNNNENINNNGINIYNYNSYKIINNTNNINKKQKKSYNYIETPDGFYTKKYKSINKNTYIPNSNSNYKNEFNMNNKINIDNIQKKNFRTNIHTNPNHNDNNIDNNFGFKKLKTINYVNKNIEKNEKLYENKISNINLKIKGKEDLIQN